MSNSTSPSPVHYKADVSGSRSLLASLATALAIAAAMHVPSEMIRLLGSRTLRRRVFEPRLARRGLWSSTVRESPKWPLAWLAVAWAIDDTDQEVVDELGLDGACLLDCSDAVVQHTSARYLMSARSTGGVLVPLHNACVSPLQRLCTLALRVLDCVSSWPPPGACALCSRPKASTHTVF
jgi:hypothetical protein